MKTINTICISNAMQKKMIMLFCFVFLLGIFLSAQNNFDQKYQQELENDHFGKALNKTKTEVLKLNFNPSKCARKIEESSFKQITLQSNKVLLIEVKCTPSSGHRWMVKGLKNDVLKLVSDEPAPGNGPGAIVDARFGFVGTKKGISKFQLEYRRPWETNKEPLKTYTIEVTSEGTFTGKFEVAKKVNLPKAKLTKTDYEVKALPSYYNLNEQGYVTPVKDQASTNACWAFGSAGSFESVVKINTGSTINIAEQWLCNCNSYGFSCVNGGWFASYMFKDYGAVYESDEPFYTNGYDGSCGSYTYHEQATAWGYTDGVSDSPWPNYSHNASITQIKQAIYDYGALAANVYIGNSWYSYTSGILTTNDGQWGHIITLVGWDDSNNCWIIKNSWGTSWGESGYCRSDYNLTSVNVGGYSTWIDMDESNACDIPTGLSTSNITTTSTRLNWNASSSAENYTVAYRESGITTWTNATASTNYYDLTGLSANTTYEWGVEANCTGGSTSGWTALYSFTTSGGTTCDLPTGLSASNITTSSARLNWDVSSGAENFTVAYRESGVTTWTNATASTNYYDLTGLSANTTYEWGVEANCSGGSTSGFTAMYSFTTLAETTCDLPTGLSASNITASSARLNWDASSGAEDYTVAYRESGVTTWTNATTSNNYFDLTGLTANTTYEWGVEANCTGGSTSGFTAMYSFTTNDETGCEYCSLAGGSQSYEWITGIQIGSFSNSSAKENGGYSDFTAQIINLTAGSSVDIELTPNTTQYSEYFVVWIDYNGNCDFTDEGELVFSGNNQGSTNGSINILSTVSGTTRMRIAMSYNSAASSSCGTFTYGEVEDYTVSFGSVIPDTQAPSVPTNLSAETVTQTSVTLIWAASTDNVGVTGYDIYRGTTLAGSSTGTSYTVTGLTCNTTYSFTVRAKDAANNISAASTAQTVATSACPDTEAPSAPTNLISTGKSESTVSLSWTASTDNVGVTSYDIYRGTTLAGNSTNTSYTVTGLSPATAYTFTVHAKDAAGNVSGASNSVSVTTDQSTITYCSSQGNNQTYEWIAGVQVGSYSNTSGASTYTNNTGEVIPLQAGSSVAVSLTPGFRPSEPYNEAWSIWIDYNKDGDFTDSGEQVFTESGNTAVSGSFTVQSGVNGTTRMRISMRYNTTPSSCESFDYGEVEDYTVSFGASAPLSTVRNASKITVFPNPNSGNFTVVVPEVKDHVIIKIINQNGSIIDEIIGKGMEIPVSVEISPGVYLLQVIANDQLLTQQMIIN